MNNLGRVAVVGIGGVGKEHVRLLVSKGIPVMLVDFPEVMEHETEAGILHNDFPGHEFDVELPEGTCYSANPRDWEQTAAEMIAEGVTHVIHATPPNERGLFEYLHGYHDFEQFVEKPYLSSTTSPTIGVGYVYKNQHHTLAGATIQAPNQGGWRDTMGQVPLIWDLLGHVLATVDPKWYGLLHFVTGEPRKELLFAPTYVGFKGVPSVMAAYANGLSLVWNDRGPFDWTESFDALVGSWLEGKPLCTAIDAILIEDTLRRLEKEVTDVWAVRDDDGEAGRG